MKSKVPSSQVVDKKELAKAGDQWLRGLLRKKKLAEHGIVDEDEEQQLWPPATTLFPCPICSELGQKIMLETTEGSSVYRCPKCFDTFSDADVALPTTHPSYVPPVQITFGMSTPYQGVVLPKGMTLICGGARSSKLTFAVKLISQANSVLILSDNNVSVLNKNISGYLPTSMLNSGPLPLTLRSTVALLDPLSQIKPSVLMKRIPADTVVALLAPAGRNLVFKHFADMTIVVKNKTWEMTKNRHGSLAHGVV